MKDSSPKHDFAEYLEYETLQECMDLQIEQLKPNHDINMNETFQSWKNISASSVENEGVKITETI